MTNLTVLTGDPLFDPSYRLLDAMPECMAVISQIEDGMVRYRLWRAAIFHIAAHMMLERYDEENGLAAGLFAERDENVLEIQDLEYSAEDGDIIGTFAERLQSTSVPPRQEGGAPTLVTEE